MHSTTAPGVCKLDTGDIISRIPQDLRQYLVDTENPQEICRHVDREHDRRIRLLLRRFTNQIQYGCTNPHCNVPTCLSYRKRAAPGPLRPHTDLTARALAVKCLEQYATHGRDLGRHTSRDKGKKKQITPRSDGLCWNVPVIPWYSNPNEHFARLKPAVGRKSSRERACSTPARVVTKTLKVGPGGEAVVGRHRFSGPLDSHGIDKEDHTHRDTKSLSRSNAQKGSDSSSQSPSPSLPKLRSSMSVNGNPREPGTVNSDRTRRNYDQASLPQSLFKHSRLQFWDKSSDDANIGVPASQEEYEDTHPLDAIKSIPSTKHASSGMRISCVNRPVTTFRILPPHAIQWFRETFSQYREQGTQAPEHLRTFLDQCLFFVIGNPTRLVESASTWEVEKQSKGPKGLDGSQAEFPAPKAVSQMCDMIAQCFNDSDNRFHILIHLLHALRNCYSLPHYLKQSRDPASDPHGGDKYLSNCEIAHVILVVLSMMPSTPVPLGEFETPHEYHHGNNAGSFEQTLQAIIMHRVAQNNESHEHAMQLLEGKSLSPDHHAGDCQLCESVADLVSHRIAIDGATKALKSKPIELERGHDIVSSIISLMQSSLDRVENPSAHMQHASHMLSCMQMVVFLKWDRIPVIRRTGPVGGALEILKGLFVRRRQLSLDETLFRMDCIPAALDEIDMPFEWLSFRPDTIKMHILQFSFLFPPKIIVRYFRSLNLKIMKQSHEKAMAVYTNGRAQLFNSAWKVANIDEVLNLTRSRMARYFVMTIRRSDILEDAIGQIWQRERRELLRPLKVILGKEEGENGLDHGGVQQEFFRLAFAQAFDPSYGMFDVDPTTRMTWFKPGALEPVYKYEALGVLMSLAIYNGVTVPITMPLAFYRKILGMKVKSVDHIEDGWPALAQSFSQLLTWNEGDVEDVMALTYDFSYDAFGETITVNMAKKQANGHMPTTVKKNLKGKERASSFTVTDFKPVRPVHEPINIDSSSPDNSSDTTDSMQDPQPTTPIPVTNANRESFVRSYIDHLTNITIQPQFTAFLKGLYTLLSPTALSLFTPSHLKLLFEGHPTSHSISIPAWRTATKYEDFNPDEPLITWFWDILEHDFSQIQMRKLLEFVTASDRLPVGGWEGVTFIVQRNGGGDDRLPGSSTCYGRLLLPEYSCKEVLRERLTKAVEEGLGFGMI